MNENRDHIPRRERNVQERMEKNSSLADGLAGRTEVQKDGAHYRTYTDKGKPTPEKKWERGGSFID